MRLDAVEVTQKLALINYVIKMDAATELTTLINIPLRD